MARDYSPLISSVLLVEARSGTGSFGSFIRRGMEQAKAQSPSVAAPIKGRSSKKSERLSALVAKNRPAAQPVGPVSVEPGMTPARGAGALRQRRQAVAGPVSQLPGRKLHQSYAPAGQSLADKMRPDLPPAEERYRAHVARYGDPQAYPVEHQRFGHGSSAVYRVKLSNGQHVAVKPLHKIHQEMEPEHSVPRNAALYDWLSSIGAHHMGVPVHGGQGPNLPQQEAPEVAGRQASVSEYAPGRQAWEVPHGERKKVADPQHRRIGMITNLLFGNPDAHANNVLISPHGHPVLIDNDLSLDSAWAARERAAAGKPLIRSIFAPGGKYAYNENGEVIGTNYSPEEQAALQEIAGGGHFGRHGLSAGDELAMQNNARTLLKHGVEGTLARRYVKEG